MLHAVLVWLTAAAYLTAGVVNARGSPSTRESFVRWGYPGWWCWVTGATEILTALLIAWPVTRPAGLLLGGVVVAAATATVVRHRELSHLAPLAAFTLVVGGVALTR